MQALRLGVPPERAPEMGRRLMADCDELGRGKVTREDFLRFKARMAGQVPEAPEPTLEELEERAANMDFSTMDEDGGGTVELEEFIDLVRSALAEASRRRPRRR